MLPFETKLAIQNALQRVLDFEMSFRDRAEIARTIDTTSAPKIVDRRLPHEGIGANAAIERYLSENANGHSRSTGPRYFGFVTGGVPASVRPVRGGK